MRKATLLAVTAVSFLALGTMTAEAGSQHGGGGGGGDHGGGGGGGDHGGGGGGGDHGGDHGGGHGGDHGGGHGGDHGGGHGDGHGGGHDGHHGKFNRFYSPFWWGYSWYPTNCHYEPRKVRVKARDRWGRPYLAWVWKNVKVCY